SARMAGSDRRRRADPTAKSDLLHLGSLSQIEHVKIAIVRTNIDALAHDHRRTINLFTSLKGPDHFAVLAVQSVDHAIPAADDDHLLGHGDRGVERLPAIRNLVDPGNGVLFQIHGEDLIRHRSDIEMIAHDSRRSTYLAAQFDG